MRLFLCTLILVYNQRSPTIHNFLPLYLRGRQAPSVPQQVREHGIPDRSSDTYDPKTLDCIDYSNKNQLPDLDGVHNCGNSVSCFKYYYHGYILLILYMYLSGHPIPLNQLLFALFFYHHDCLFTVF